MIGLTQLVLGALALITVPISLLLWLLAFDRRLKGQPVLPAVPRRPVPWTLLDLLILAIVGLFTILAVQLIGGALLGIPMGGAELADLAPPQRMGMLLMFSAASLLVWAAALAISRFRSGATWRDLGLDRTAFADDVQLGVGAFVMLVVPMMMVHIAALAVFGDDEVHPFIELITADPNPMYLVPVGFAAVFVAPLVEETLFRVLLQGWLERVAVHWESRSSESEHASADAASTPVPPHGAVPPFELAGTNEPAGHVADIDQSDMSRQDIETTDIDGEDPRALSTPEKIAEPNNASPSADPNDPADPNDLVDDNDSPWKSPQTESKPSRDETTRRTSELLERPDGLPRTRWLRWLPIFISSFLFAGAHTDQGPAPISLFLLAIGLGYLYQRTHRIVPCMVVHFLVNALAVLQLSLVVFGGE